MGGGEEVFIHLKHFRLPSHPTWGPQERKQFKNFVTNFKIHTFIYITRHQLSKTHKQVSGGDTKEKCLPPLAEDNDRWGQINLPAQGMP